MSEAEEKAGAVLERLYEVIEGRRGADPEQSYVARLLDGGGSGIARKVGEEAIELVMAATAGQRQAVVSESADLLFHMLVLWAQAGVRPAEVLAELERREGVSGLEEKRRRREG